MGSVITCFLIVPLDLKRRSLRRYSRDAKPGDCPFHGGYHNAMVFLDYVPMDEDGMMRHEEPLPKDDPRWNNTCACGYQMTDRDHWQMFPERAYRIDGSQELTTLRDAPAGAMWYADWMLDQGWQGNPGPDGRYLMVKTPGGDWSIDSRASNCTLPNDNVHKCWVRTGVPPLITVGKNGVTCGAGAGSILAGKYHGFLRNGRLEEC